MYCLEYCTYSLYMYSKKYVCKNMIPKLNICLVYAKSAAVFNISLEITTNARFYYNILQQTTKVSD